jgi:hypothetical protein
VLVLCLQQTAVNFNLQTRKKEDLLVIKENMFLNDNVCVVFVVAATCCFFNNIIDKGKRLKETIIGKKDKNNP